MVGVDMRFERVARGCAASVQVDARLAQRPLGELPAPASSRNDAAAV